MGSTDAFIKYIAKYFNMSKGTFILLYTLKICMFVPHFLSYSHSSDGSYNIIMNIWDLLFAFALYAHHQQPLHF